MQSERKEGQRGVMIDDSYGIWDDWMMGLKPPAHLIPCYMSSCLVKSSIFGAFPKITILSSFSRAASFSNLYSIRRKKKKNLLDSFIKNAFKKNYFLFIFN